MADYMAGTYWPAAERRPASLPGSDIMNVPFDVEVKARRDMNLTGWLKQAAVRPGFPHLLVVRPDGYGVEKIRQWPAVFPLWEAMNLINCWEFEH